MKDQKKPGSSILYRIGFCVFLAVVFLTVPYHTAAQEKPLFTGSSGLFSNQNGDAKSLFKNEYRFGTGYMSNQPQIGQIDSKPRVSALKFLAEILVGVAGNVGGGYAGVFIGLKIAGAGDYDDWYDGWGGAVIGYSLGSTVGTALGVYLVGDSGNTKGSFGRAYLGALAGEGAAILLALLARNSTVTLISLVVLPPIGAAVLFNSSLRYKSPPVSHALLNFNRGDFKIGIPYVHIQPLPGFAKQIKPTVRVNVNLLSIVL